MSVICMPRRARCLDGERLDGVGEDEPKLPTMRLRGRRARARRSSAGGQQESASQA
jgi:hypothetical protein